MNYVSISNAIAAGTHRVRTYRIERGRTRYVLEKLNDSHGWLPIAIHGNTVRRAIRYIPHRYDMTLGVIYDATAIEKELNGVCEQIAAEAARLLSQPNSLQMPEDVRIDMAVCMACDKYRQEFSEDVLKTIQKTKGEQHAIL